MTCGILGVGGGGQWCACPVRKGVVSILSVIIWTPIKTAPNTHEAGQWKFFSRLDTDRPAVAHYAQPPPLISSHLKWPLRPTLRKCQIKMIYRSSPSKVFILEKESEPPPRSTILFTSGMNEQHCLLALQLYRVGLTGVVSQSAPCLLLVENLDPAASSAGARGRDIPLTRDCSSAMFGGLLLVAGACSPCKQTHCWINVGPASTTLAQHWCNNGSGTRVCSATPVYLQFNPFSSGKPATNTAACHFIVGQPFGGLATAVGHYVT